MLYTNPKTFVNLPIDYELCQCTMLEVCAGNSFI